MRIASLKLNNFRAFSSASFNFSSDITVIVGENGSGKTSLLEALYYACYLKSFRTHTGRELINFESDHFFIEASFAEEDGLPHAISVGFSPKAKVVKFDKRAVRSYRDLIDHYRVISCSEDDLELVKGAPEARRTFLNHSLMLEDGSLVEQMRTYRQITHNRNNLIQSLHGYATQAKRDELFSWTEQLWRASSQIASKRVAYLVTLEAEMNGLLKNHFSDIAPNMEVCLDYHQRHLKAGEALDEFTTRYEASILPSELRMHRGLFGAHLDDIAITFRRKRARMYASRGQQKLVVLLAKIAQQKLLSKHGTYAPLLIDDFFTDFDDRIIERCFNLLLGLSTQIIVTTPLKSLVFAGNQKKFDVQTISL